MKILLLDDNEDRIADIEEIVYDKCNAILVAAHSLEDAENKLKLDKYVLVIVDLVVPLYYKNRSLSDCAGYELVKFIFETTEIDRPHGVIVVSDHLKDIGYFDELNLYPISIIDTCDLVWKTRLQDAIDNYWFRLNPVDIAIVTAVDVEFAAIYDENTWKKDIECGALTFYRKIYSTNSGNKIHAILFQCESKGMVAASLAVSKLFENYCPNKVFMIGISAGNPSKTDFGDIIVAIESCDYSNGAITESSDGQLEFESEATLISVSDHLANIFRRYSKDSQLSYTIRQKVNMSSYRSDIKIRPGLMACGPLVVKSKKVTEKYIRPHNKNYLGIDMESYAVYYVCKKNNCTEFLTIKSVSDHADTNKTHEHQEYCSKLSTELLEYYIYNEL